MNLRSLRYLDFAFYRCQDLREFNLVPWNLNNLVNMESAFRDCTNLEKINFIKNIIPIVKYILLIELCIKN